MNKQELIDCLNDTEYISGMELDELLDWYIDCSYDYYKTTGDDRLDKLFEKYWDPTDIVEYVVSKLKSPVIDSDFDALKEVADLLRYKDFETNWSYMEEVGPSIFEDVNKEELERLRQRLLNVLTKEDNEWQIWED